MNAQPFLAEIARHLRDLHFDVVLIGNAAAAVSDLFRVVRDDDGLQLDFMATIHGVRTFAGLQARAHSIEIGGTSLLVASLDDIIRSKNGAAPARPRRARDIGEDS